MARTCWAVAKLGLRLGRVLDHLAMEAALRPFDAQGLVNVCWSLATLLAVTPAARVFMGRSTARARRLLPGMGAQGLANVSWAYAKLVVLDSQLFEEIGRESVRQIGDFGPQGVANLVWAFATVQLKSADLLDAVADEVTQKAWEAGQQNLSNTAWAYAKLAYVRRDALGAISREVVTHIEEVAPQGLANVVWSFATALVYDRVLFCAARCEILRKLPHFQLQNIINSAWAFAKMSFADDVFMATVLSQQVWKQLHLMQPRDISTAAWACAAAAYTDGPLMDIIAGGTVRIVHAFSYQDLSNISWSYGKLLVRNYPLFEAISCDVLRKVREFWPQNLSITMWAYGQVAVESLGCSAMIDAIVDETMLKFAHFDPQGLASLALSSAKLQVAKPYFSKVLSESTISKLSSFKCQELSNVIWGFARLEVLTVRRLLESIKVGVTSRLAELNAQDISTISWSFARVASVDDRFMTEIAERVLSNCESMNSQDLANTAWAYAKLAVSNRAMVSGIAAQLMRRVRKLIPQELSNITWSLATLSFHEDALLEELLGQVVLKADSFATQNIANIAWSEAKLEVKHCELMHSLSVAATAKAHYFDAQGIANTVWAFSALAFRSECMDRQMLQAALRVSELGTREMTSIAWALDVCGDFGNLEAFLPFCLSKSADLASHDIRRLGNLADVSSRRGASCAGAASLDTTFEETLFRPLSELLRRLQDPDLGSEEVGTTLEALGDFVSSKAGSRLGLVASLRCLELIGVCTPHSGCGPWVEMFRTMARSYLKEWSIPRSDNVVAVASHDVACERKLGQLLSPARVVTCSGAAAVAKEARRFLRPIPRHILAIGTHAEEVVLLELIDAAITKWQDDGIRVSSLLRSLTGTVQLYITHCPSLSSIGVFSQFRRCAPDVSLLCAFDSAWHSFAGEPRPIVKLD